MYRISSNTVVATEIAEFLQRPLEGPNLAVYGPGNVNFISDNSLVMIPKGTDIPQAEIRKHQEVLVICHESVGKLPGLSCIRTPTPEKDFVRAIKKYFVSDLPTVTHPTAVVERGAKIGKNVSMMANCYIGPEVEIGDNTYIFQNTVISGKVRIGKDCVIKANSVIGSEVFDFVFGDEEWEHFPKIGRILIGNHVWIGANSTIERGSSSDTVIEDGVKIDDLVQIGSGSIIGSNSIVAAGTVVCAQVTVGKKVWIAPQSSVRERVIIGDQAFIGLGSVVIHDIESGSVMAGNPVKALKPKTKK